MPPLDLSTRAERQNTQLHCYGSFTGYASWNESSSGCVFWRTIVCLRPTSEIVAVSALLTPRHCGCCRLVELPSATAPLHSCSAGMEQSATRDSGLLLTFSSVILLTWRCPLRPSADVCVELYNSFRYKLCKVPPQLCNGSIIILTFLLVVVVVVESMRHCKLPALRHFHCSYLKANKVNKSERTRKVEDAYNF